MLQTHAFSDRLFVFRKLRQALRRYPTGWLGPTAPTDVTGAQALVDDLDDDGPYSMYVASDWKSVTDYQAEAPVFADHIDSFKQDLRFLDKEILQLQAFLRSRGVKLAHNESETDQHVRSVVERVTTRHQIKLGLMRARDDMKRASSSELHSDIHRSFRKAIDELGEQ